MRLITRGKGDFGNGSNGFNVAGLNGDITGQFALDSRSVARALSAVGDSGAIITPTADVPDRSNPVGVWVEGHFGMFSDKSGEQNTSGDFFVGYAGVDVRVRDRLLLGLMAEIDWTEDRLASSAGRVHGTGWMAGPYLSAEPVENVFFDLRAMWGQSKNYAIQDILGSRYEGNFDTDRWLVNAIIAGIYQIGNIGLTPDLSLIYMDEKQKDFSVSDGLSTVAVDGQEVEFGRLATGLKVSYLTEVDEIDVESFIAGHLLWDFENPGLLNIDGTISTREDARGKLSGGVSVRRNNSFLGLEGTYDGLGSAGLDAFTAKVMFSHEF